jgi:uncharacterized protein (TIGR03435 family)
MQQGIARNRYKRMLVAGLIVISAATMRAQINNSFTNPAADVTAKLPAFEVATIKAVSPNGGGIRIAGFLSYPGGRVIVGHATVQTLIYYAFDVQTFQISGGTDWAAKDLYDVEALPPDSSASHLQKASPFIANPTDEQRKMILSLLIDRFGLKFHREIKEGPIFLLTRDSTKLQMQPPKDPDADPRAGVLDKGGIYDGEAHGINTSMPYLAKQLTRGLGRPVLDQTGLKGSYDFDVAPYDPTNTDFTSAAIESLKRIGLKLKADKGPVETIVIDTVMRPTEN